MQPLLRLGKMSRLPGDRTACRVSIANPSCTRPAARATEFLILSLANLYMGILQAD